MPDLERRALALGAALQQRGLAGERALILLPPGLAFVDVFLGCLCAGVVAVPAAPPAHARRVPGLTTVALAGSIAPLSRRPGRLLPGRRCGLDKDSRSLRPSVDRLSMP